MRILHFADLHLDASFAGSGMAPEAASRRREELRRALRRIMDLAVFHGVGAVTIAGDLYEQDRYTLDTGNFLREQFERIRPIQVVIAPGNHDPWVPDSLYRRVPWPDNVFIFQDQVLRPHSLREVTIWGAAHCSPACRENLIAGVRVPPEGAHLLLLHASDISSLPDAKLAFCPLTTNDIEQAGFDLALLGHYHGARLSPVGRPVLCYPGSPESLGFDELGKRHVLLLEIDGDRETIDLLEVEHRPYEVLSVDVSFATTRDSIREKVAGLSRDRGLAKACVRLHLTGTLHAEVDLNPEGLLADLKEHFAFLTLRDETHPGYDVEALKQDLTVKGAFVRKMAGLMEKGSTAERDLARDALFLGLQSLEGRELRPG
ncbi:MAG: metallophosphoesterase family protein [Dehalococcoidia bacterium]|nr:metallophosphoesterase family protein [Dehalococcoidia bacterium]